MGDRSGRLPSSHPHSGLHHPPTPPTHPSTGLHLLQAFLAVGSGLHPGACRVQGCGFPPGQELDCGRAARGLGCLGSRQWRHHRRDCTTSCARTASSTGEQQPGRRAGAAPAQPAGRGRPLEHAAAQSIGWRGRHAARRFRRGDGRGHQQRHYERPLAGTLGTAPLSRRRPRRGLEKRGPERPGHRHGLPVAAARGRRRPKSDALLPHRAVARGSPKARSEGSPHHGPVRPRLVESAGHAAALALAHGAGGQVSADCRAQQSQGKARSWGPVAWDIFLAPQYATPKALIPHYYDLPTRYPPTRMPPSRQTASRPAACWRVSKKGRGWCAARRSSSPSKRAPPTR